MKRIKTVLMVLLSLLILEFTFAIHEYGHLKEFQKRSIPIKEFSLGIGPLMYQYQVASFVVSFRLIPIMAYVAPTKEGENLFEKQGLWDKIAIDVAGVRNNFLIGLITIFFLQFFGWTKGNISFSDLAKMVMVTPFKILLRFFSFLVGCITWGRVNLAKTFLLSTGGIDPPAPIKKIILWNLTLGFFNLAPIFPLDGGHVAQAILSSIGSNIYIPQIPDFFTFVLFYAFYMSVGKQDMRVLEIELKEENKEQLETLLRSSITSSFFFTTRVTILLLEADICTIGELQATTAKQLLQIKGFGRKSLREVEIFLAQKGLSLKPEKLDNNEVR